MLLLLFLGGGSGASAPEQVIPDAVPQTTYPGRRSTRKRPVMHVLRNHAEERICDLEAEVVEARAEAVDAREKVETVAIHDHNAREMAKALKEADRAERLVLELVREYHRIRQELDEEDIEMLSCL